MAATQPCSHIGQLLCVQFQQLRIVDGRHGDGRAAQNVGIMQLQIAPVHVLHQRLRQALLVLDKTGKVNVVVLAAHHNGVALAVNRAVKAFQIRLGFLLVCFQLVYRSGLTGRLHFDFYRQRQKRVSLSSGLSNVRMHSGQRCIISAGAQSGQHEHGEQKCYKFVVFHNCLLKNFMLFSSFIYINSNYPKKRTAFLKKFIFTFA